MKWSFSNNNGSSVPQLMSFHEEKPKTGFDALASTGLVSITTSSDTFDSDQKSYTGSIQKTSIPDKQSGVRYSVTNHPVKHLDAQAARRSISRQLNLTVSPSNSSVHHQSFDGHNQIGVISPQPLAAVPLINPVSAMPSRSPVVGTTDLRSSTKISRAPAQLTIFYNGSVCVYDNISAEKAQAIMLLAGNGPSTAPSKPVPAPPVQASRSSVFEGFLVTNKPYGKTHISPAPMTSISVSSAARSGTNVNPPARITVSSPSKAEPLRTVYPIRSVPPTPPVSSGTVPQFRKKSLARFLEKRKERVISTSPYGDKPSPDCSTPGAASTSFSMNSSDSCPVPAVI